MREKRKDTAKAAKRYEAVESVVEGRYMSKEAVKAMRTTVYDGFKVGRRRVKAMKRVRGLAPLKAAGEQRII